MASRASFGISDNNQSVREMPEANYSLLTIVPAGILDLKSQPFEYGDCVLEVEPSLVKRPLPPFRIIANPHTLL